MLKIDHTIISLDLLEQKFVCDITKCKGACCRYGDSGAPLEEGEGEEIEKNFHKIKPFLRKEGILAIEAQGAFIKDDDGDLVTPLINGKECAYTYMEDGVYRCGIEKAWLQNKIKFRKPVSCHLFPVRRKKYPEFEAVNYEKWAICQPARILGKRKNVPVYKFLKEALVRVYGKKWYGKLEKAASLLDKKQIIG
ncbi:MAG: DUF3109 family protein [Bacteroidales bacterium]|nr:DUF3109 family protein [Bacteroidales bacterium]